MRAVQIRYPGPIESLDLPVVEIALPAVGAGQLLLRVAACGVCHTDLHIAEGELRAASYPITPGHQVVGRVEAVGTGVSGWRLGDRAGVAWLHHACGACDFCRRGESNLCPEAAFTGLHVQGGYAEAILCEAIYTYPLVGSHSDLETAPLLCAGIIGLRSLRKADLAPGERLGLIGFGASAHLALQVARAWDCQVHVYTRSETHRRVAMDLGASWAGGMDDEHPVSLDRAVLFAPAGELVPAALAKLRPGGTLALNAIHMTAIPGFPYETIYGERTLRSVANATYQDGVEFLELADRLKLKVQVTQYPLDEAKRALCDLKQGRVKAAAVLLP